MFTEGEPLVDACCGAGVDALASARRGPVVAVDHDESMVALARSNAAAQGFGLEAEACSFDARAAARLRQRASFLHVDPDRRKQQESQRRAGANPGVGDQRTNRADAWSPSLEVILDSARHFDATMIKLAPLTMMSAELEQLVNVNFSRAWIGSLGECRQQLLLAGDLRSSNLQGRLAILADPNSGGFIDTGSQQTPLEQGVIASGLTYSAEPETQAIDVANHPGDYIFDLHAVLHASGLQSAWSEEHGLRPLGSPHGYFTADRAIHTPWAQCFEVLAELPWDDRQVRKWLRQKDVGVVDVKNRLVRMDAAGFQRRYSAEGSNAICLLVTRLGRRTRAIAARRC